MPTPDPNEGFTQMVNAWNRACDAGAMTAGLRFWYGGNALDTIVSYLVQAKQKDTKALVAKAYSFFATQTIGATNDNPIWWRTDYGWWGVALLDAIDAGIDLGLDPTTKENCKTAAQKCWDIMYGDWVGNQYKGVRNGKGQADTITNILFLLLAVRRAETHIDGNAINTAADVFLWFYGYFANGLFNDQILIRAQPGDSSTPNRAWSADQGLFLNALSSLGMRRPDLGPKIQQVINKLRPAIQTKLFVNYVLREPKYPGNFDMDHAPGPGAFMRQFWKYSQLAGGDWSKQFNNTAQGAGDYSGWDDDIPNQKAGCFESGDCKYAALWKPMLLWDMVRKASAQDAFNTTLPP